MLNLQWIRNWKTGTNTPDNKKQKNNPNGKLARHQKKNRNGMDSGLLKRYDEMKQVNRIIDLYTTKKKKSGKASNFYFVFQAGGMWWPC